MLCCVFRMYHVPRTPPFLAVRGRRWTGRRQPVCVCLCVLEVSSPIHKPEQRCWPNQISPTHSHTYKKPTDLPVLEQVKEHASAASAPAAGCNRRAESVRAEGEEEQAGDEEKEKEERDRLNWMGVCVGGLFVCGSSQSGADPVRCRNRCLEGRGASGASFNRVHSRFFQEAHPTDLPGAAAVPWWAALLAFLPSLCSAGVPTGLDTLDLPRS